MASRSRSEAADTRFSSAGNPTETGSMPIMTAKAYSEISSSSRRNGGRWVLIAVSEATSAPASVRVRATSVAMRPPRQ
ncbi:hypothetical protein ACFQXA_09930 [Nocardiopsis composta]